MIFGKGIFEKEFLFLKSAEEENKIQYCSNGVLRELKNPQKSFQGSVQKKEKLSILPLTPK